MRTSTPNTQPGFLEMTLAAPSLNVGGITISVSAIGGISFADRDRNNSAAGLTSSITRR